ncbi:MAG: dihydrolipoamide acetyltransferase family protein [Deinococcaceae bacterium]
MATQEMLLPELAESVVEGEILKWLVEEGAQVALEQPVVEVMTDKVTVELPAPFAGTLTQKLAKEGEVVGVHKPIALFEVGGSGSKVAVETTPKQEPKTSLGGDMSASESAVGSNYDDGVKRVTQMAFGSVQKPKEATVQTKAGTNRFGRALATPAARAAARTAGIDILSVPGSGPLGRVNAIDVSAYLLTGQQQPSVNTSSTPATQAPSQPLVQYKTPKGYEAKEERIPLRGMRKAIAKAMLASHLQTVRTLTVDEADLTDLMSLRGRLKPAAEERGIKLTYLPFFVKAAVAALKKYPMLNASIDEAAQEIVKKNYHNIGIAVDTDAGLLVPVIRDIENKSILEIAHSISDLAGKARAGKLTPEETSGGTFSLTNMGSAGSLVSFPIINAPETAILGIHTINERPVGRNGQIVLRHMMYLSLSFDHRLVDGADGARFLREMVRLLENPDLLLLEAI